MHERINPPITTTGAFWGAVFAISQGVRLIRVIYRPDGTYRNRYVLDNTDGKGNAALQTWFDTHPDGGLRAFVSAYYVLVDAIRQAERVTTPAAAMRG